MTRVLIETLGCKLNQAESEEMRRNLTAAGYRMAPSIETADVLVLNTCTVTHAADRKARQAVRSAVAGNPVIAVVITGCYAERDKNALSKLPGVIAVLGNSAKEYLAAALKNLGFPGMADSVTDHLLRNRSMIKIQDGCDHRCSYCVVPLVRPKKSCVPPNTVIMQIKERQTEGIREVVLTGTEIGEYFSGGSNLSILLGRILKETTIERIRISSLQPQEVTRELIAIWHDKRLCRHFHLSLQSGSDAALRRMRRRYSLEDYRRSVDLIRKVVPDAGITTDIIAGFPGENESEFEENYRFIEGTGFSRLHVFPYSPRPGTDAAAMPGRVDPKVVKLRVELLLKLGRRCEAEFRQRFKGQELEVLFEEQEGERWVGYTDNYIRVTAGGEKSRKNDIVNVRL